MQPRDRKLRPQFALVVAMMVVLGLAHSWVNPWLAFDRGAIEQGQWWRIFYLSSGAPEPLAYAA